MNKGRILVLFGSLLLIIGGFLPWISVPNLFGLGGSSYEGIEVGWEGDGVLTLVIGLILVISEIYLKGNPHKWIARSGVVLAGLAASVVLLDLLRILEIAPVAGFFAATDIGIYMTLAGALTALIGCLWGRDLVSMHHEAATTGSSG